jgi:hypothetical protein
MRICRLVLTMFALSSLFFLAGCRGSENRCSATVARDKPVYKQAFDRDSVGRIPARWAIAQTNPGKTLAAWEVIADPTAPSKPNVLALTKTENVRHTYNLAIADRTLFKDLDLSVSLKGVSGKEDQGGGPIWRCIDENNYYICRINPLETNFRVYKVVNAKRTQLQSAEVITKSGQWYTLRVLMVGNHIECYLDGEKMLDVTDDTFTGAGKVGLWTKADAATCFDDLTVREIKGGNQ